MQSFSPELSSLLAGMFNLPRSIQGEVANPQLSEINGKNVAEDFLSKFQLSLQDLQTLLDSTQKGAFPPFSTDQTGVDPPFTAYLANLQRQSNEANSGNLLPLLNVMAALNIEGGPELQTMEEDLSGTDTRVTLHLGELISRLNSLINNTESIKIPLPDPEYSEQDTVPIDAEQILTEEEKLLSESSVISQHQGAITPVAEKGESVVTPQTSSEAQKRNALGNQSRVALGTGHIETHKAVSADDNQIELLGGSPDDGSDQDASGSQGRMQQHQANLSNLLSQYQNQSESQSRNIQTAAIFTAQTHQLNKAPEGTGFTEVRPGQFQSFINTPINDSNWHNELGGRVLWMAKGNIQSAEVRLNPPHMGPIEIRIVIKDDQAAVTFNTHHAAVKDVIEAALPRLREMFSSGGLQLSDAHVSEESSYSWNQGHDGSRENEHGQTHANQSNFHAEDADVRTSYVNTSLSGSTDRLDLYV